MEDSSVTFNIEYISRMNHLQKILFLIPLYFISCTTSQVADEFPAKEELTAIGFNAKVQNSRAVSNMDATENDVKTNGFSVWGGYEGGTTAVFTGKEEIILGGENSYTTDKYWTYNTYNFYAVYPIGKSADYNVTDNTFTINYNSNTQEDLLFAKVEDHEYPADGKVVSFNFGHLLSHISIKLKTDETQGEMKVTGISLDGLNVSADYSPTNGWSNWQRKSSMDFKMTAVNNKVASTPQEFGEGIFVIPQQISEDMKFIIRYTYTPKDANQPITMAPLEINIPQVVKVTVNGNVEEHTSWPVGMSLIYSGTISLGKIEFSTPKVESWGATQSSGTIIIK